MFLLFGYFYHLVTLGPLALLMSKRPCEMIEAKYLSHQPTYGRLKQEVQLDTNCVRGPVSIYDILIRLLSYTLSFC